MRRYELSSLSRTFIPSRLSSIGFFPILTQSDRILRHDHDKGEFMKEPEIEFVLLLPDELVDLIRLAIEPDSWEQAGAYLEAQENSLLACNRSEVLDEMEAFFNVLKAWQKSCFEVGVFAVRLEMEEAQRVLGKSGGILTAGMFNPYSVRVRK